MQPSTRAAARRCSLPTAPSTSASSTASSRAAPTTRAAPSTCAPPSTSASPSGGRFADRFCWDYWHVPGQYTLHRAGGVLLLGGAVRGADVGAHRVWAAGARLPRDLAAVALLYADGRSRCSTPTCRRGRSRTCSRSRRGRSARGAAARRCCGPTCSTTGAASTVAWPRGGRPADGGRARVQPAGLLRRARAARRAPRRRRARPRAARLVLHGWFTEPVPHFEGGLDEAAVVEGLAPAVTALMEAISPCVSASSPSASRCRPRER